LKINFKTVVIGEHTGYGNASRLLVNAMEGRGVDFTPDSSIQLNFCMPPDYEFRDWTVGYTPWESTEVPDSWYEGLGLVDDLWSTSQWSSRVLERITGREVFTLPHGIDPFWEPRQRELKGPFTFLHVGEPAVRKGGDILLKAWHKAFRHRKDVRLIFKCNKYPMARVKDRFGSIISSPADISNIQVIGSIYSPEQMRELYYSSHCLVYPTRGEGFGLIPFEAMATGMPAIFPADGGTGEFCNYSPHLLLQSKWVRSPEDRIHPGLWMDHDLDEVIYLMERMVANYRVASRVAYASAQDIHQDYSWETVADRAIARLGLYKP